MPLPSTLDSLAKTNIVTLPCLVDGKTVTNPLPSSDASQKRQLVALQCQWLGCQSTQTEVMVFLIDMASVRAHLWGLGNMDGSSVIFKELAVDSRFGGRQLHPMLLHLLEEVHQDNRNAKALR
jgi:hypothetical protein